MKNLRDWKLGTKLLLAFLLVGVLPAAVIGLFALSNSSEALSNSAFNQLDGVREIKKAQIENFFAERRGDMGVLLETAGALRAEGIRKLVAVRDNKRNTVERYIEDIYEQVRFVANDKRVIEAAGDLAGLYGSVIFDEQLSADEVARRRGALGEYYRDGYGAQYAEQNGGGKADVETMLGRLDDAGVALQYAYIQTNEHPLGSKHKLDRARGVATYHEFHEIIHPTLREYLERFGYYDIFLIGPDGSVVYSVFKELDFATSLENGSWADSGLAAVYHKAKEAESGTVVFEDFRPYTPSYDAPAGFVASPIHGEDGLVGVVAFQFPIDRLNAIMTERAGLGETGESYLIGPDRLMRSDSYLDPEHHSVIASFRDPRKGRVDTDAARDALAGKADYDVIVDYNGNPVLSAYTPVKVGDVTWALLAEIDIAEAYSPVDQAGNEYYKKYVEMYGYYDLFLITADGYVFYTAAKEADYRTNMVSGKYRDSGLGTLTRKVLRSGEFGFADFAPYAPSNNEPASFIAEPLVDKRDGEVEMVVALQLSLDAINGIMQQREGMGETGESYLIGADRLMRSDSFLDPQGHSVKASFAGTVAANGVDTEGAREALAGNSGAKIIIDYNGNPVLSSYTPLEIFGVTWALLAEIDEAEAFAAVRALEAVMLLVGLVAIVIIVGAAVVIARSVTRPVARAVEVAGRIAAGDLTTHVEVDREDEIGQLMAAMASMNDNLAGIVGKIREAVDSVSQASGEIAQGNLDLSQRTEEQASSLEETASSMEELTSTVKQNADNARQANQLVTGSREEAEQGGDVVGRAVGAMSGITTASKRIADIIGVIDEIAFQTNLLALNAAVEAARAGEQGRGFAVVAAEVRKLAQRSADSAKEIKELIQDSVVRVEEGSQLVDQSGDTLRQLVGSVKKVSDIVAEIAAASAEQSSGIEQVNKAVMQMDEVTQQNAALVEEAAAASKSLDQQARDLQAAIAFFKTGRGSIASLPAAGGD